MKVVPYACFGGHVMGHYDETLLRFFRDDIGGILITDEYGTILYSDKRSSIVQQEKNNWTAACPPPQEGQKAEPWDLLCSASGKTFIVLTSTIKENGRLLQIHHLVESSLYTEMYRFISEYSKSLRTARDHDSLTGLFNKGKFLEMKDSIFKKQDSIALLNLDVNNLKITNDTCGHENGDRLLKKAAESLKRIEARNIIPFRVGGDEFVVVAIHVNREQAEDVLRKWENVLAEMNREEDGLFCDIACGFVYTEKEFDFDELLAWADKLMYEDKKAKKAKNSIREL